MIEQLNRRFEKLPLRLYFIGIGGTGMSGLALLAQEAGYQVSGSDLVENEATARLRTRGIKVFTGHDRERIKEAEAVVVSSAIPEHNEELREARRLNLLVVPRGEMLAFLMNQRKGIAVAGTHGKTTTTSMVSLLLEVAGLEPTALIGGELEDIGGNAKCGKSEFFVAEADESDGSFLRLSPFCAVVTNIEDDHLEFYGDMVKEKEAFATFLRSIQKDGFGVACGDHENVVDVLGKNPLPRVYTYGIKNPEVDFWGRIVHKGRGNFIFEVFRSRIRIGDFRLNIPGIHNVENALACIAVGIGLGIRIKDIQKTLASFRGVKRRFEKMGIFQGALVIDDYAHHPTEMRAVLDAALHFASGKIMVVFQPHRYTRTGRLYKEMAEVLLRAHRVALLPIYPANENPIPGVSTRLVYQEMRRMGFENVTLVESFEEAVVECQKFLQEDDIIITMGAGDVWKVGARLCGKDGKE